MIFQFYFYLHVISKNIQMGRGKNRVFIKVIVGLQLYIESTVASVKKILILKILVSYVQRCEQD